MSFIPADLQQNISVTMELTFLHNYLAILYFVGLCLSTMWSIWKPSRAASLAVVGFGFLLFSFEYQKHILEPLKDQTVNSLITMQEHTKVRRVLDLSLVKLIPKGSIVIGILSLFTSSVLFVKK